MILESGSHVLIAHRRLFEADQRRLFVGTVDDYDSGIARITGYTWLRDPVSGVMVRKQDLRTKIVSLSAGTLIVYQLPSDLIVENVLFSMDGHNHLFLEDGKGLRMDLSENT